MNHRQCMGFGQSRRLIIKDETDNIVSRFSNKQSTETSTRTSSPNTSQFIDGISLITSILTPAPDPTESTTAVERISPSAKYGGRTQWYIGANQRLYNQLEHLHLAVLCCRQTVTLRTLTWVMSDAKWLEMIPKAMQLSEALTCAVRANAANYMAKAAGAITTPYQAYTEYASALKFLQRDLYHPVKQTSNETLFAVLLLGIFDVRNPNVVY
jgi:hypothetical protein